MKIKECAKKNMEDFKELWDKYEERKKEIRSNELKIVPRIFSFPVERVRKEIEGTAGIIKLQNSVFSGSMSVKSEAI